MDPTVVTIVVCVAGSIAMLVALIPTFVRAVRAGDFSSGLAWYVTVALTWPIVALMLEELFEVPLQTGERQLIQAVPLILGSLSLLLASLIRRSRPTFAGGVCFSILLTLAAISLLNDSSPQQLLLAISLAAVALVPSSDRARDHALLGLRLSAAALTVSLAVYASIGASRVIDTGCGLDSSKCFVLESFVNVGGGGGSNAFGLILAMVLPAALQGLKPWQTALGLIGGCLAVWANGSRTALFALALTTLLVFIASAIRRRWVWAGALTLAALGSAIPVLMKFPEGFATGRGTLWGRAQDFFVQQPWLGNGISFWVRQTPFDSFPQSPYSPHNLWWELLVSVGIVGVLLIAAAIAVLLTRASESALPIVAGLMVGITTTGLLEASVMPYKFGPVAAPLFALLAIAAAGSTRREPRDLVIDGAHEPPKEQTASA